MKNYLVSINDLPPDGKNFQLEDQEIWLEPLREFKMDCKIESPLAMKVFVMPADGGCLVRGELTGGVILPCNRCAEDAKVAIDSRFDEFEEIPQASQPAKRTAGEGHVLFERNAPMLNLAEVAWEQFMLAMPTSPLCRQDCKGLCVRCGANLNLGQCACEAESGDERLAPLKNLTITRQ